MSETKVPYRASNTKDKPVPFAARITRARYVRLKKERLARGTSINTILNHAIDTYFKTHGSKEWLKIISLK